MHFLQSFSSLLNNLERLKSKCLCIRSKAWATLQQLHARNSMLDLCCSNSNCNIAATPAISVLPALVSEEAIEVFFNKLCTVS